MSSDTTFGNRSNLWIFLGVSFGGAWLAALPLWLSGQGLRYSLLGVVALAMMFTPSLGVLAVWLHARRRGVTFRTLTHETGLALGPRKGRTLAVTGLAWIAIPLLIAVTLLVSSGLGLYASDLAGLSGLRKALDSQGNLGLPPETMALIMVAALPVMSLVTLIPAFGEEWGWRGWLMPRLMKYGTLPALVISGVIWGLWHAPLTLLGYNYPSLGGWAAVMFVPFCVLLGAVLAWTRMRTGSVWPAAIGHAVFNDGTGTLIAVSSDAAEPINTAIAGPIGLVGWVIFAAVAMLMWSRKAGRSEPAPASV